jgi:hypothetical protein
MCSIDEQNQTTTQYIIEPQQNSLYVFEYAMGCWQDVHNR